MAKKKKEGKKHEAMESRHERRMEKMMSTKKMKGDSKQTKKRMAAYMHHELYD